MSHTVVLIPLRSPGHGKTRLRASLDGADRATLAIAMFSDVVAAVRAACPERILVVAAGSGAARAADGLGVASVVDPPGTRSLDQALAHAADTLRPEDDCLIVAADLPRLTSVDLEQMLHTDAGVVVAPTRRGGTGGLLRRPVGCIPTSYGPDSARRHRELAMAAGAGFLRLERPAFHDDVDTPSDLALLSHGHLGAATSRWFEQRTGRSDLAG